MKISKLLNKKKHLFFLICIFFTNAIANEPIDIWNIDKSKIESENKNLSETATTDEVSGEDISVYELNNQNNENSQKQVLLESNLEQKTSLYGLYDPDKNNLSIDMWSESDGDEIKNIFNRLFSKKLSRDALDILEIALLTNSSPPIKNISNNEFYNYQKEFLIEKNNLDLIKLFIEKNNNFILKDELVNHYVNYYLAEANIEKANATIKIYLENAVGIGEHPNIIDEIDKQVDIVSSNEHKIDIIRSFK